MNLLKEYLKGSRGSPDLLIQELLKKIFAVFEFWKICTFIMKLRLIEGVLIIETNDKFDWSLLHQNVNLKRSGRAYVDLDGEISELEFIKLDIVLLKLRQVLKLLPDAFALDLMVELFTLLDGFVQIKN